MDCVTDASVVRKCVSRPFVRVKEEPAAAAIIAAVFLTAGKSKLARSALIVNEILVRVGTRRLGERRACSSVKDVEDKRETVR